MLMLSSSAPAVYALQPHTSEHCPMKYDFVVLFLNKQFKPGETTLPPVVNVSQCLNLASLRTCLAWQSGAQASNSVAVGQFYLCSPQKSSLNMVPMTVPYSEEQREVKRFCDEIDWYEKHQRLNYNCELQLDTQSFNGAPIICWHEGRGNLVGISSTGPNGDQVVTLYGICQLLAGGLVPLFAAMRHPSPRTLLPFRWSLHILPHLATNTVTNKGHLLEMFHLLVDKEEGAALVNLFVSDKMEVSVTAMEILSEILKKFSGPEELKEVIRESHVFEPPNTSEDDFKESIVRVCKRLQVFMQYFSSVQRGTNTELIVESVFHCTETMLYWRLQYPDVAEHLLSNENVESAAKVAENYQDLRSINTSFEHIRQRHGKMVELDLERMRQQTARLQKELEEKENELKNKRSDDHMESRNVQSEEEKERLYCAHVYYTKDTVNTWKVHFVVIRNLEAYVTAVRERYSGAVAGPELDVIFEGEEIVLDLPKGGVTVDSNWTIAPLAYPKVAKKLVDTFESGGRLPCCQLWIKWRGRDTSNYFQYRIELKGAKEPSNFFLIALECEPTTKDVNAMTERQDTLKSTRSIALIDREGVGDPYSVWTCSLIRQEQNVGLGVIVQLDSGDEGLQSLLPCLGAKHSQQMVNLQTNYALLTCHSNLNDDHKPKHFNLNGLQACVGPARDTVIPLQDCISCAVSCCGPTSMLMLSSSAPAEYTLLPHTSEHCPIGYNFVVLFLNKQFKPGETTLPPVVNVSQCLNLVSLRTCLAWQSGAQASNSVAVGQFYVCSPQKSGLNMVPMTVPYSEEQREVKRFCDEIDWYEKHQRLNYNCSLHLDTQSFNGAPIICRHEGRGNLAGISSTGPSGDQVVTLYGICQLLAGGPVPLFAAMRHPSPRTLSPYRWGHHIFSYLATNTVTNKGHLLEMFHLLVNKKEGTALVNLIVSDTMKASVTAMEVLSEILKKFSGPEELKEVIRESHVFDPPNTSEDDFKGSIVRVCKRLQVFMQYFSSIQQGRNPKKILESVFHCTETMLYWRLQYPDVTKYLLSNENAECAARAASNYQDSRSINISFEHIRQCHDKMVEQDLERMRWQTARLQKELEEKEQKLKRSEDYMESTNIQSEEKKERLYCAHVYYTKETVNTWKVHFVVIQDLGAYVSAVRERYSGAVAGPELDVIFVGEEIVLDLPKGGVTVNSNWTITPLSYPKVAKNLVDTFESGGRLPSCQLWIKWRGKGTPDYFECHIELKGAKKPNDFFLIAFECETTTKDVSPMTQKTSKQEHAGRVPANEADTSTSLISSASRDEDVSPSVQRSHGKRIWEQSRAERDGETDKAGPSSSKKSREEDASPITQKTSTQEHTGRVPGNEADISISLMPSPSSDDDASPSVQRSHGKRSWEQRCEEGDGETDKAGPSSSKKSREFEEGCLGGMDVIGETTLSVTNEEQTFHWAGYGLKLHIPPASLPAGVEQTSIKIKASLAGRFNFPQDTTLVSAVYCLQSSVEFSQPIAVLIQHCGMPRDDLSLTFTRASTKEPPYVFTNLQGGLFPPDSSYACIQLDMFSRVAIIQVFKQLWSWLASQTSREPERLYCAHIYYTKETVNTWKVHFVVTHNLEAFITAVRERYSGAVAGTVLDVIFEGEEIVLDLPREGVTVNNNWTITPLAYPKVAKNLVDTFESGGRLPSCQLRIKWRGRGTPDDLEYRVALRGAKEPSNFFLIALECETTTKDVSPMTQKTRRQEHAGRVPGNEADTSTSLEASVSRDEDLAPRNAAGLESEPELSELMDQIASRIPNKWRAIGIALGLTVNELSCFSANEDPSRCFTFVFTIWRSRMTREPYSWGTVVQALRAPSVGELKMAEQLENRLTNQP